MLCGMMRETIRKAVPVTDDELALLVASRTEGSAANAAAIELLGPDAVRSEAAILHGVLALGLSVVKDRITDRDYAALSAAQDDEDHAYQAALRRCRRDTKD